MSSQVIRPRIPYKGCIPNGLHPGKLIEIKGSVPYGTDLFEINLLTGLDAYSDRPLHVSVRFNGRFVARNTLMQGVWGSEERGGIFPFNSGQEFQIMILVESNCYRIAVNNQHCFEFNHRIPISRVTTLHIDGSVAIERIEFIDKQLPGFPSTTCIPPYPGGSFIPPQPAVCPQPGYIPPAVCPQPGYIPPQPSVCPQPAYIPPPANETSNLAPVYNPSIPYAYPIYGGLKPGMMIYISGRPSASSNRFTINFQSGTSPYPPPDIAFHLDARFFTRSVVRNSRTNNVWEREECLASHFPFQQAVNFDMMIRVEQDRFMVALNGQHFIEFRHRLFPLSRFDTLYIENDIVVSSIRFA
ncbi:galectin-4 isoform X2 [Parasteatoda tepidariorum]|uniref:galectin-4 isoform X2 n=1 Tax=Parasteatoda tepidariorum TaxID=114398 RepID=UPI001C723A45|nr:galectin-4 isoform X2 [Parasteatoda tepidariorum]